MSEPGGYHDDRFEPERTWRQAWRRSGDDPLLVVSTALIVVGAVGVVGWLWAAGRSQGLLGADWPSEFDASSRIDFLVGTLDQLVIAVLGIAIGVALRRHAEP